MPDSTVYRVFSTVYDAAIDPATNFLFFLRTVLKKRKGTTILDLGCGTGKYSILLAEEGHNVQGVDFSKEMLAVAKKKARERKQKINFGQGDITCLKLKEKFDFAVSCDCINHFLDEKELLDVFYSTFNLLEGGGKFIFQMYPKNYFYDVACEEPYGGRSGKNFFLWENYFFDDFFEIVISTFTHTKNNSFKRTEESVLQRAYPKSTIVKKLKQAGFESVQVYGRTFKKVKNSDLEWYFVANKGKNKKNRK
jgi:ubiquinone/menaquinone biosynthesis C-methylase UbiE